MAATATPSEFPNIGHAIGEVFVASKDTPSMIWIGLFVFTLLLSYVLGHLFYRRDPKDPDRASFDRLYKSRPDEFRRTDSPGCAFRWFPRSFQRQQIKEWVTSNFACIWFRRGPQRQEIDKVKQLEKKKEEEEAWLKQNLACTSRETCEFPYPDLADYLRERGHEHLVPLVRWSSKKTWRSKTYINLLKIRLSFHYPEKYRRIIRNEAHVRLATSTWYVARALARVSYAGLVLIAIGLVVALSRDAFESGWESVSWVIAPLIAPITVLSLAKYAKLSTERFVHYQRLREVFNVLELAYTAFRDDQKKLFSNDRMADPR